MTDILSTDPAVLRAVRHYYRALIGVAVATAAVMLTMLCVLVWLAFVSFDQREQIQRQAELITDCTTPGGECYEQSQKRTEEAVAELLAGIDDLIHPDSKVN